MYKKEFIDTIKTLLYCMCLFFLIPIARMLETKTGHAEWEFSGLWQPVYLAVTILFAVYSGVSIFQAEKKDRAMEYMLTLPVSRLRLLAGKVLPRLAVLAMLMLVGRMLSFFTDLPADALSLLILFLTAVFVSLAVESLVNGVIGVVLLNAILYYTSLTVSYLSMTHRFLGSETPVFWVSQVLPALLLLVPLGAAFFRTLKRFDARPLKWQAKPYLYLALPAVVVMITFIILSFKQYFRWIHLPQ